MDILTPPPPPPLLPPPPTPRLLDAGVARAGIDVYRIKTYGQQVEDQHV